MIDKLKEYNKIIAVGLIFFLAYIFINTIVINNNFEVLKKDYLKEQAFIIGKMYNINPEYAKDIVNSSKEKEKYIEKGLSIINEYGYDNNINIEYMEPLSGILKEIKTNNIKMNFIMVIIMTIICIIIVSDKDKKINILKKGILETLDGNFDYDILKYEESSYGKLAFAFDDVRKRLRESVEGLEKKKGFLVNLLSDISHQLKTPLASLKVYNEILEDDTLSYDEKRVFLYNSKLQINRMEWLVQNLLRLAKFDAGAIIFRLKDDSLNRTIEQAIYSLKDKFEEKNITINITGERINILHDPNWLKEAFINIIKNAIEHSYTNGYIEIILEDNSMYTNIKIRDNGTGINEDELCKVFNRFYKSQNNKSKESVGIGLSLTKAIVEGHGGIISVNSEEGVGTTFSITLTKEGY
ncbi:sensor histidine kinase [Clostridium sp.]|uniref:sensor histidine kinase n=1 Tax=Clostridium sp. TaxID=1506 RepID=UPI002FC68BFB